MKSKKNGTQQVLNPLPSATKVTHYCAYKNNINDLTISFIHSYADDRIECITGYKPVSSKRDGES